MIALGTTGSIQTYTGRYVQPLDLKDSDVDIVDIAHALAHQCRFSGHCRTFYSVAEHSVRVSWQVADMGGSIEDQLYGLLHDAAEAYLVDMPSPIKRMTSFGEGYRWAEHRIMHTLALHFGLQIKEPEVVKAADRILVLMEQRDLMPPGEPWSPGEILPEGRITPWPSPLAERVFATFFRLLWPLPSSR